MELGIGILIALGVALWIFRNPLARMLLILAVLLGVAVAVWLLFGRKNQSAVALAVGGAVLLAVVPIHGYAESRPSKGNFCRTYLAEKRRYLARYGRTTGDPLRDLGNGIGAMSSWVPMFDRLSKVAPDEIRSDVEHIRDSLEAQQHAAGEAVNDPLGTFGASLLSGLMAMDSWERVGNYVDENCEPHQTAQVRSVQATAATAPQTTSPATDDTIGSTDAADTTDTTGPPVELALA